MFVIATDAQLSYGGRIYRKTSDAAPPPQLRPLNLVSHESANRGVVGRPGEGAFGKPGGHAVEVSVQKVKQ